MKRFFTLTLLTSSLIVAGCDRGNDQPTPPAAQQNPAAGTPTAAPATAPVEVDPAVRSAGLHLNEAQDLINDGKVEEADAKLKEVEAVKDKLPVDQKDRLDSLRIACRLGQRLLKSSLTKPD